MALWSAPMPNDFARRPDPAGQTPDVWTPTLLNQRIRARLVDLKNLRLQGEVSQPRPSNGHLYFTLKDRTSSIPVTVWRTQVQKLDLRLRDGDEVVCTGQVDHYVRNGRVSFVAYHVQQAGVGALWVRFQQLKEKLTKEGLFDRSRKKRLPFLPRTVGIVTSPTGAALRDMLRILRDRMATRVIIAPAKVQGAGAGEQIAAAINALDRFGGCDVIICGRGGGSIEDLWAFNEEPVVRAIAACATPIVSAVGHETDTMLSDYAADVRAPTPTSAAEKVVPLRAELVARIAENRQRIRQRVDQRLQRMRQLVATQTLRLGRGEALLVGPRQQLDESRRRLVHAAQQDQAQRRRSYSALQRRLVAAHPLSLLRARKGRISEQRARLLRAATRRVTTQRQRIVRGKATLIALNPRAALQRGYAIVRDRDGVALRDASNVEVGTNLHIVLSRGALGADVTGVEPESP